MWCFLQVKNAEDCSDFYIGLQLAIVIRFFLGQLMIERSLTDNFPL